MEPKSVKPGIQGKNKTEPKRMRSNCEMCQYYDYDEEYDTNVCTLDLDEDEMVQFMSYANRDCPYFKFYDEYKFVQKQN